MDASPLRLLSTAAAPGADGAVAAAAILGAGCVALLGLPDREVVGALGVRRPSRPAVRIAAVAGLAAAATFIAATAWSMPLIALTHVPIVLGEGWLVGGLAALTAAVTWQLFERDYPPTFPVLVMVAAIIIAPLTVWALARRVPSRTDVPDSTSPYDAKPALRGR